jgi:hypothetical protein
LAIDNLINLRVILPDSVKYRSPFLGNIASEFAVGKKSQEGGNEPGAP